MNRPKLQIIYFATAMSLVNLGDTLFYVIVPTYYTELGLIPFQVGILLSVNRWIRLATNYPVEYCYRCHPSDLWLLGAFTLGSITCMLYGIADSFLLFLLARIGWGITYSFLRQAGIMHVVSVSTERTLAEQMGYFTGINSLWRTSGLLLGALCHDLLGFTRTFMGIGILSLISLPLIRMSQRHSKLSGKAAAPASGKGRHGEFFCLGAVMGLVGGGMITSTLGLVLKTTYGDSFALAGIVVGAATLTGFVMAMRHLIDGVVGPVLGAVADRVGHSRTTGMLFCWFPVC